MGSDADPQRAVLWGFWPAAGVLLAGYVGLFLAARRPVSLRPGRLAAFAAAALAARLLLLALGASWAGPLDLALAAGSAAGAAGLLLARGNWLLRAEADALRQQLQYAGRGLFLPHAEPSPGLLVFTAKGSSWRLRLTELGRRLQRVGLPRPPVTGKMALLVHWLSKQYPGPVPRLRITLTKE
jgi:hypothetical protein